MEEQTRDKEGKFTIKYPVNEKGEKQCSICKEFKKLEGFKFIKNKNLYETRCRDCFNRIRREKWRKNPIIKAKEKQYQDEYISSGRSKEIKRKWKENNYEYNLRVERIRQKERRTNDPIFRLRQNITRWINNALRRIEKSKSIKVKKSDRTEKILGCSFQEYYSYLLEQKKILNLNNELSSYVIDHIRPVDSFDLQIKEQQFVCFNFRNTQPMSKDANIKKSSSYDKNDEIAWAKRMRDLDYEGDLFLKYKKF